jgi:hypothetical protein
MKNKQVLGALAMDLKRVALGYFRGSSAMADRFFIEALKRRNEIDSDTVKPYVRRLLRTMENIKKEKNDRIAEDALLYSTLFQNASGVL